MWSTPAPGLPLPICPLSPQLSRIRPSSSPSPPRDGSRPSAIAFIALHAGAGYLHPTNHPLIRTLMQTACNTALQQATTVEEAVVIAISVLESSPLTNAALGSCLTEEGKVECEASIVMGNGAFGSVGATRGVDHPIQAAYRLAAERDEHGLIKELSRVRPISLVGEGAYRHAVSCGLGVVPKSDFEHHHVTDKTRATWQRYREMIAAYTERSRQLREEKEPVDSSGFFKRLKTDPAFVSAPGQVPEPQGDSPASTPDTVGAIACDRLGRVCAASSSGGIWMKHTGRLGSSSTPGSGCYAENYDDDCRDEDDGGDELVSVAAAVSGCGESLMEQFVALRCCEMLKKQAASSAADNAARSSHDIMQSLMQTRQTSSSTSSSGSSRSRRRRRDRSGGLDTLVEDDGLSTGIIALTAVPSTDPVPASDGGAQRTCTLRFCWAHTAQHFAVGYAGDDGGFGANFKGEAWVSVLPTESRGPAGMKTDSLQFTWPMTADG
jgi:taspase (threonine aspartase 1)